MPDLTIDLVTAEPDRSAFYAILVHPEPWGGDDDRLLALAERLQTAINWMADGGLQARFPESEGAVVQLVLEYVHETRRGRARPDRAGDAGRSRIGVSMQARRQADGRR